MDAEKRHVDQISNYSTKEETKIENLEVEYDHENRSDGSLESQESEKPVLKRSLKARHLAVSFILFDLHYVYVYINNFYYFR
jgi:amino acid permease